MYSVPKNLKMPFLKYPLIITSDRKQLTCCFQSADNIYWAPTECQAGFPGGSVVENLPANAGDMNSIPDLGRFHMPWSNKAWGPQLLSLCFSAREPQLLKTTCPKAHALQQEKSPQWEVQAPQLESGPHLMQLEKSPSSNEDSTDKT